MNNDANDLISLTKKLISIPSVTGNESEILGFCADWMQRAVFTEVTTRPLFTAGVIRGGSDKASAAKRALILCGHVDTVAAGDENAWDNNPWQPWIEGDRSHGLGVGDMKIGVALQMLASAEFAADPRPELDIWCVQVAGEEVDGSGSMAFTEFFNQQTSYEEVSCLIAEPTDGAQIEIGHRGNWFVEMTFHGQSGHASQEENYQTSSLPKVVEFLNNLEDIRRDLHDNFTDEILGKPSFTPTRIAPEGSFSSNKTAADSLLAIDVRTTPKLDDAFRAWMDDLAAKYGADWKCSAEPVSSALCPPEASVLRLSRQLLPDAKVTISPGATDQAFFQNIGINTIIYGPGDFSEAHTINESASIQKSQASLEFYRRIIANM